MGIRVSVRHGNRSVRVDTDSDFYIGVLDHIAAVAHALLEDHENVVVGGSVDFGFQPPDEVGDDDAEG